MEATVLPTEPIRPTLSRREQREVVAAFGEVSALLNRIVEEGALPGVVLLVGRNGEVVFHRAVGLKWVRSPKQEVQPQPMASDTVFDLGSLTASVATTTLIMKLVEAGKVKLTDRVTNYIQGFGVFNKSQVTVADLLFHSSGLMTAHPFYEELMREHTGARMGIMTSKGARDYVINAISRSSLKYPPRTKQVYSDIGFILLGHLAEVLTGVGLDKALHKLVLQPLGLKSSSFIDLSMVKRKGILPVADLIAPTAECSWRGRLMWGEVFDENAWAMGGIAGHAGLFSNAFDVHLLGREILIASRGGSAYLKKETVRSFLDAPPGIDAPLYLSGWEKPHEQNGAAGCGFSPRAFGCEGSTGCSLWLEPDGALDIVLMTNVPPGARSEKKATAFRADLYKAILGAAGKL